jgi:hypothetical protein
MVTDSTLLNLEDCVQDNDKWAIRSIHYTKNGKNIAQALIQGNAVAICDGSYKDHFGTAGFVIQRWNSKVLCITGAHITPEHPEEINPYRSKLNGILAIVIVTNAQATFHDIQEGTIKQACYCESGITAIFHTYGTPKQPHHNIIHKVRQKIAASQLTWKFRHVSGHQDKFTLSHLLDIWGQLNVKMDCLAKAYWNETYQSINLFYSKLTYGWSLWIVDQKLSSWDRQALYNHAKLTNILDYWSTCQKHLQHSIRSIDWEACQQVI